MPLDDRGEPAGWPATYAYVPPGFHSIWPFDLGNGDLHGFYWPLGRERDEPIVCETYHDGAWLQPHASSLEGCVLLKWAEGFTDEGSRWCGEAKHLAERLDLPLGPLRISQEHEPPALTDLLRADPLSPAVAVRAAREYLARGELDQAERHLLQAVQLLPEYTEARSLLAGQYRRLRRPEEAAGQMLHALRCPPCFGGDAGHCLRWLQRFRDDLPGYADDPLWRNRQRLTFKSGVTSNDDYLIYEEAVAAYLERRQFFEAVTLRLTCGQLMLRETTPFQERYGFTW